MHPIFFLFFGPYDDLAATQFDGPHTSRTVIVGQDVYIGVVEAASPKYRQHLNGLHPNLILLPGPNSNVSALHVQHLNKYVPDLKIKEGDSMRVALSHVFGLFGDHQFDPDAY